MKTRNFLKDFLILPFIIFDEYILMIVLGYVSCLMGLGDCFYFGLYCIIGIGILILSAILLIYLLIPGLRNILTHKAHAQAR